MTLVAELLLSSPELPLVDVVASVPSREVELVHVVQLEGPRAMFVIGVDGDSREAFESMVADRDRVSDVTSLGETADGWLYRLVLERLPALFEAFDPEAFEGVLVESSITGSGYREEKVFSDYEAFERLREQLEGNGVALELLSISSDPDDVGGESEFGLTARQREALETAVAHGYYDSPRRVSTEELGEVLGISSASTSELLRRAERQLIGNALTPREYVNALAD